MDDRRSMRVVGGSMINMKQCNPKIDGVAVVLDILHQHSQSRHVVLGELTSER